ncbi:hypothetical protein D3C73_825230 [compost metagenome]
MGRYTYADFMGFFTNSGDFFLRHLQAARFPDCSGIGNPAGHTDFDEVYSVFHIDSYISSRFPW